MIDMIQKKSMICALIYTYIEHLYYDYWFKV